MTILGDDPLFKPLGYEVHAGGNALLKVKILGYLMDLAVSNDAQLVEYSVKRDENMCRGRCPRRS